MNLWTGGPLFALWVGSHAQGSGPLTMFSLLVVTVVLLAVSLLLVRLIAVLQAAYGRQTGEPTDVRSHAPWLRSMRGERPLYPGERARISAPERVLVAVVIVAVLVAEVWFFFFSGSPFDQRSGRAALSTSIACEGSGLSAGGA